MVRGPRPPPGRVEARPQAHRQPGRLSGQGRRRMTRYDLKGRAALVTGGASGIGLATATMLAENGCKVAINHLADDPRGPEQVEALRGRDLDVIGVPGNVGDARDCE